MRLRQATSAIRLIQLGILVALVLTLQITHGYSMPLPALSQSYEAESARSYMNLERQFVEQYIFDNVYGGAYYSVDGAGNVLNSSKDIIFQANVILFLAGMQSQDPDPRIVQYVNSAASFIVDYLKWGTEGPGTWYESSNRMGSDPQPMTWPAPSEAYISWALLWAYRITGNSIYLDTVQTNLNYQMVNFPDGRILTDAHSHVGDVTFRSPERMTYYSMYQLTGNRSYLDFANKVQKTVQGVNGQQIQPVNGASTLIGLHGNAIVDEVLYGLVTGDQGAISEGSRLLQQYWAGGGYATRDDIQNKLIMDMALWTITHSESYRAEAIKAYNLLLAYWDPAPPYGFWSLIGQTKTCFSRGYPLLDLTPPAITADPSGQIVTATITDPSFTALDMTFNGIGVNPSSVYLFYSIGGGSWSNGTPMNQVGNDTYTITVPTNIASQNPTYLISASDYFNNTSTDQFTKVYAGASSVSQQTTTRSTSTQTVASQIGPLVTPPATGSSFPIWLVAIAGGLIPLILIGFLFFRRPQDVAPLAFWRPSAVPPPPAGPASVERNLYCACPYWIECARVHSQCPTCTSLRQYGACCACYIMPPDSCKHPSGLGPVYGPYVNYGPPQDYHQPHRTDESQT